MQRALSLLAIVLGAACGTQHADAPDAASNEPVDAGSSPPVAFPAPHPAPPQIITEGGPILLSPKLIPVFFSGDDASTVTELTQFLSVIGASDYWTATTAEYGVGPTVSLSAVQLPLPMTGLLTSSDVDAWLLSQLQASDSPLPAPDASSLYVVHFPASVALSYQKLPSCDQGGIGGYHSNIVVNGMNVAYVAMARCDSYYGLSGVDELTGIESHVLVGAVVDPYPATAPAFAQTDVAHLYWILYNEAESPIVLSEPPDACARAVGAFVKPAGLPYTVQRSWSNTAAMSGLDPCVPALAGEVYFAAAPELDDQLPSSLVGGQSGYMAGVNIPAGHSKTIPIDLFSDGAMGPWKVEVNDFNFLLGEAPLLSLSLDHATGQNGDQLQLTITPMQASANHTALFVVTSHLGAQVNSWVGVVGD